MGRLDWFRLLYPERTAEIDALEKQGSKPPQPQPPGYPVSPDSELLLDLARHVAREQKVPLTEAIRRVERELGR